MSTVVELPRWDMSVIFPSLESSEFAHDFAALKVSIDELERLFERHAVGRSEDLQVDDALVGAFNSVVESFNHLLDTFTTVQAYIYSFVATDSRDNLAQARYSELQQLAVRLSQLDTRFTAWIGSMDIGALQDRSETARELSYLLQKTSVFAHHQMSPAEEDLAAELAVTGSSAWDHLHQNLTSQIMVDVEFEGERPVPMTVVRNMAFSADREVRRRGYEAELEAWKAAAIPLAAAMNSIKGETNTLQARRGWQSPLDAAVFGNNIDGQTLQAMMAAAHDSFPTFRRYLRAKARALGIERLAWYDLFAPVGKADKAWEYDESAQFIVEQFSAFSPRLSDFAARAFRDRWIDAGPRPGKTGGAFCMSIRGDESRILANYIPSYDSMSTLAHELGHGYHNLNLAHRPALQREHPMTLAETASIFCQTIVEQAALRDAGVQERIAIIESSLQDRCQVVVDITSRFLFEKGVFERRKERELSMDELNELMLDTQRQTYGDGLDPDALHPYMWAVKSHYYGPTFYNYPYMFGLLFGLGLYARFEEDPDAFRAGYDDLLSSTGIADAATLASRFGIDIRGQEFWSQSLGVIRRQVDAFEDLIGQTV